MDETGIDSYLYREYGYSLRGQKVYDKISGKKFQRTNIIAAKFGNEIIAPMQYNSKMDSALFELCFEKCLLLCPEKGTIIVMDNASFHRKKQLTDISARHQRTLIFLPPYSHDLNPIENFWAYLKSNIRNSIHTFRSFDDYISFVFQVC